MINQDICEPIQTRFNNTLRNKGESLFRQYDYISMDVLKKVKNQNHLKSYIWKVVPLLIGSIYISKIMWGVRNYLMVKITRTSVPILLANLNKDHIQIPGVHYIYCKWCITSELNWFVKLKYHRQASESELILWNCVGCHVADYAQKYYCDIFCFKYFSKFSSSMCHMFHNNRLWCDLKKRLLSLMFLDIYAWVLKLVIYCNISAFH